MENTRMVGRQLECTDSNVFFNWIFGFEGKVRIKGPEDVKEEYKTMVTTAAELAKE